jgi:hypothetical protein
LIVHEGAAVWLFRRLRALRLFETLPVPFQDRLKLQAFSTSALSLRVEDEAVQAVTLLTEAGIPVVLIKGIARRALAPSFPFLDARPTSDVDLLVPEVAGREALDLLLAHGYEKLPYLEEHHHLPPVASSRRVSVELHLSSSVRIPAEVAWARATEGGQEVDWAGIRVRVPSATEMAWAAITHAVNGIVSGYRLQHFLEVVALAASPGAVRWDVLEQRISEGETFDEVTGKTLPAAITRLWIDGASQLLAPPLRPPRSDHALDLVTLLRWRMRVLGSKGRLSRSMVARLLEEGGRSLIGYDIEGVVPGSGPVTRARRNLAGRLCRVAFGTWRRLPFEGQAHSLLPR